MISSRVARYLHQTGCSADRPAERRAPNEACNRALRTLGFSTEHILDVERSARERQLRRLAPSAAFNRDTTDRKKGVDLAAIVLSSVDCAWKVHQYSTALPTIAFMYRNWDTFQLAYSVAYLVGDTIGWDTTAELSLMTAQGSVEIGQVLVQHSAEVYALAEALGYGAEAAALTADLTEALVTGGLSLGLTAVAWGVTKWMTSEPERRLKELEARSEPVQTLHVLLASGGLPRAIQNQLALVPAMVATVA